MDYLLTGERSGITLAGNILTDVVKNIDCYPEIGMLANVTSISRAVGGSVPNTGIDLARIDNSLPLSAVGCVGDDEYGRYLIAQLRRCNIDTSRVVVDDTAPTSSTDVMNLPSGERTFFHARGANAKFNPSQVKLSELDCRMLHIGYILLLDEFDRADPEYGTVMARFLHDVQQQGIRTSVDVVSDSSADFPGTIIPALHYCDNVIINEIECCNIWGYHPRKEDGSLNLSVMKEAMEKTMAQGVTERVIVHAKEAGLCLSQSGEFTVVPSLKIPVEEIRGSVGAGDAFCAGSLYGIYHGIPDRELLEFASAAAACSLFAENAVDGMKNKEEIEQVMARYPRRAMPV